jgi:hypothetical protein
MPTLCRCHVASAIDTPWARRLAHIVKHADPGRHQRLCPPVASDQCPVGPEKLLPCRLRRARTPLQPSASAQPNPQIPISLGPDTAGSFLGDFRTPGGVRNSSRYRNGGCGVSNDKSRCLFLELLDARKRPSGRRPVAPVGVPLKDQHGANNGTMISARRGLMRALAPQV